MRSWDKDNSFPSSSRRHEQVPQAHQTCTEPPAVSTSRRVPLQSRWAAGQGSNNGDSNRAPVSLDRAVTVRSSQATHTTWLHEKQMLFCVQTIPNTKSVLRQLQCTSNNAVCRNVSDTCGTINKKVNSTRFPFLSVTQTNNNNRTTMFCVKNLEPVTQDFSLHSVRAYIRLKGRLQGEAPPLPGYASALKQGLSKFCGWGNPPLTFTRGQ